MKALAPAISAIHFGHNAQQSTPRFPDQDLGTRTDILWPLYKLKHDFGTVTRPQHPRRMINRNDSDRLSDRIDMAHGLVPRLNRGIVVEHEHLGLEPSNCFGNGVLFGQNDHAFAELGPPDFFQGKSVVWAFPDKIESNSFVKRGGHSDEKQKQTHETLWPASADSTSTRFFCIDLIDVGINCPTLSGPSRTLSPTEGGAEKSRDGISQAIQMMCARMRVYSPFTFPEIMMPD